MERTNTYPLALGYEELCRILGELDNRHACAKLCYIGESLFGRPIPCVLIGEGRLCVYVGGFCGCDGAVTRVLLGFALEYAAAIEKGGRIYNIDSGYLAARRTLCIIPQLNPDGGELSLHGAGEDCPLRERLLRMNGSSDFSLWQGNGRGCDLRYNFAPSPADAFRGEYPESEPETAALARFLRMNPAAHPILAFTDSGASPAIRRCRTAPRTAGCASMLSRLSGFPEREEDKSLCGLLRFAASERMHPALEVDFGGMDAAAGYARLREVMFTAPVLG
ncbi:MAG: hypothetical protein IJA85_07145 [Clostridia bacterium]|nr:hypothetical protein [Clostridia bacterium]